MFESLKKKLKSLLGTDDKKPNKEKKAPSKKEKKKSPERAKKPRIEKPQVQEVKQEEKKESSDKQGFFSRLTSTFSTGTITKDQINSFFDELEIILLENNVALEVVDEIRKGLITQLEGKQVKKDKIEETIKESLKEAISTVLQEPKDLLAEIRNHKGPFKIIFFGINGSGKTTSLAKISRYLEENKISSVLAAGDTFRAASIEQLEIHGKNLGKHVVKHSYGADPAAVAFDAIKYAEAHNIKVVLIDTAGRMYTKENLIREMEKIIRVVNPDLKLFVGEAITGNDATEQARTFNEAIGIDGIILTKADVDEKGGTALSVSQITQKPIYFLGMGQRYDDLKPFKKKMILDNLGL